MRVLIYVCCLLSIISCGKQDTADIILPIEVTFDVPVALNTVETHFFQIPNVPTFLDLSLDPQSLTFDDITSIKSRLCQIEDSNSSLNLDFINRIIVNVYEDDDVTELFYFENIPFGNKQEIQLLASIPELKEALSKDFVNFEVGMRFRQFPPANFNCRANMEFSIYTD